MGLESAPFFSVLQGLVDSLLERGPVYMAGVMDGALATYRIKTGRVGHAEVLNFPRQEIQGLVDLDTDHLRKHVPGSTAGRPAQYLKAYNAVFCKRYPVFWQPELVSIESQIFMAAKATACKRGQGTLAFAARGNDRYSFPETNRNQVMG